MHGFTDHRSDRRRPAARERGVAYLAALSVATLVMIIGLASVAANRITTRRAELTNSATEARFLATAAVDYGLLHIDNNPGTWRADFTAGTVLADDTPLDTGTISLQAIDTIDGDLTNDTSQEVLLRGTGKVGEARMMYEVMLDGTGMPITGTWRRGVN